MTDGKSARMGRIEPQKGSIRFGFGQIEPSRAISPRGTSILRNQPKSRSIPSRTFAATWSLKTK